MKVTSILIVLSLIVFGACKKSARSCKCKVIEEGTTTTTTMINVPPIAVPLGEPSVEPYYNETSTVYNFDNVSKKDMNAACPTKITEEINGTIKSTVAGTLIIEITNVGERKRTCTIQ